MKKWLCIVMAVMLLGVFVAGSAVASQYNVSVLGGAVAASSSGVGYLPGNPPLTSVLGLDPLYDPFVSGPTLGSLSPLPGDGTWNAVGWWTFAVTGSSGSDWNNVFGGGTYHFEMTWNGQAQVGTAQNQNMPEAYFSAIDTFADVYGKWYENNASVWTYFGLYASPNTGLASDGSLNPVGIFAFVADSPGGNYDFDLLYDLTAASANSFIPVTGGTGLITATAVPEPTTMLLLGLGMIGLAGVRRMVS